MADLQRIGARISAIRKTRGWSGKELARRASVSYSLLSKVETGAVPASPALIGAVARALRVDVPRITGQPYEERVGGQAARLHATLGAIRLSVDSFDLPDDDVSPRSLGTLTADVRRISALGQDAKFIQIGEELPGLLDELCVSIRNAREQDQPRLYALLAEAYSGGSVIANILGYLDLRDHIVERIRWASELSRDPLRMHRVQWQRTHSLMAVGGYRQGLTLMNRIRDDMGDDLSAMSGPELSVYGSAHLRSAILAARAAKTGSGGYVQEAWAHMDAAREVSEIMGIDRNDYGLAFGPSNVFQHEVAVAVELEDGVEAVTRSRRIRLGSNVPAIRRGHHYIDLARGYALAEDYAGSLRCLQRARQIAPQQTRHHPMVRETILSIAAARRGREELSLFASWLGIN